MSRAILFGAIGMGLILRLALAIGFDRPLVSDERDYDAIARALADTGRFEEGGNPTAIRTPLYPWFVSAFYRAGGDARAVAVAQGALDLLVALFLHRLLRRRDPRAATIAGAAWALYPAAILYTRLLLSETLFTVGLVAWIAMLDRGRPCGRAGSFLLGAWLGALVLMRPIGLILGLVLPWLLRGEERTRTARPLPILLGLALVLAPWMGRNIVVLGTPTLTTSIGTNLLIGNHPRATGAYSPPEIDEAAWLAMDEVEADRASLQRAAAYMAAHPGRTLRHGLLKLAHTARPEGELLIQTFLLRPEHHGTRHRRMLGRIPLWLYLVVSGSYAAVALLGLWGLATLPRDRLRDTTIAMILGWAAVIVLFLGGSRFHQPLMPFLLLFAARAPGISRARFEAMSGRRALAVAVASALLLAIWGIEARFVIAGGAD